MGRLVETAGRGYSREAKYEGLPSLRVTCVERRMRVAEQGSVGKSHWEGDDERDYLVIGGTIPVRYEDPLILAWSLIKLRRSD